MGGLADYFNPKMTLRGMFSESTSYGLDPLNLGDSDDDRAAFSAPGSKGLKAERDEKAADKKKVAAEEASIKAASLAEAAATERRQNAKQYAAVNTPSRGLGSNKKENLSRSFLLRL